MLVYEKKVNDGGVQKRHLFGTFNNIPSDSDVKLTYKDADGDVITASENDTYFDDKVGGIIRKSDGKAVNVFIGDTCIIGKVEPKVLVSISVKTQPAKVTYVTGDPLDLTGLEVEATYGDGDKAIVTGYTTSPANGAALAKTDTSVTVSFNGKSTSFTITVSDPVVKSTTKAVKEKAQTQE